MTGSLIRSDLDVDQNQSPRGQEWSHRRAKKERPEEATTGSTAMLSASFLQSPYTPSSEDDVTEENDSVDMQPSDSDPVSLEGPMQVRRGRTYGLPTMMWKRRYVVFSFQDGGSITVYRESPEIDPADIGRAASMLKTVYRMGAHSNKVALYIPPDLPWVARDIANDASSFVVEIPVKEEGEYRDNDSDTSDDYNLDGGDRSLAETATSGKKFVHGGTVTSEADELETLRGDLIDELSPAKGRKKPLRIYFRCNGGNSEKALWLNALLNLQRLASTPRTRKGFLQTLTAPMNHMLHNRERVRTFNNLHFARETRQLETDDTETVYAELDFTKGVERLVRRDSTVVGGANSRAKEFRVLPEYAYPHRWMTRDELREEMVLPSDRFHDLRLPACKDKEIGCLKVEVLQCLGLPKLDRTSDTDAVVYMVCGSYAFNTDIIPNRVNPMWLRKVRRACEFPLFHGYAQLFVGVFDDDGEHVNDDFAGRVVINLAQLRPRSTYDVTLPLRLSTHVYTRRRRGAIRLRFSLSWHCERDMLLSYIPKNPRIPLPQHTTPNHDVTVMCADQKVFHNICITIHGSHLPRRFTFHQMKASIREMNFTRKYLFNVMRQSIRDTRTWVHPKMSAYVFGAWMHCVYANAFSLVPAYTVLYVFLILMWNYAKYGMDGAAQRGFVPPSWEEMFGALLFGRHPDIRMIEPQELGSRPVPKYSRRKSPLTTSSLGEEFPDYKSTTHVPKGRLLFRALGFLRDPAEELWSVDEDHAEFPFASGVDYPKFGVRECLVNPKGEDVKNSTDNTSIDGTATVVSSDQPHERPERRFSFELDFDMMRQDSSGMLDADDEEKNFKPFSVFAKGNKPSPNMIDNPPKRSNHARGKSDSEVVFRSKNKTGGKNETHKMHKLLSEIRQAASTDETEASKSVVATDTPGASRAPSHDAITDGGVDPALVWPDQNIDIEGPSTGKKLTDDLAEIKDKMHEMTWHLFDDYAYTVKNPNALFFGDAKKPEKRRKTDVKKQLDKVLKIGPYSHSNPFVARVGMYVEPIIGSVYSFLCFFRAGYNVATWRDPILTFWLSFFCGVLSVILFLFPWRIFMLIMGLLFVGPQNWAIRVLRERGHLPPAKLSHTQPTKKQEDFSLLPTNQPVVSARHRQPGNVAQIQVDPEVDPREIHHVVVPYSPLVYQRFNDWPPEPQYAQVKRDLTDEIRPYPAKNMPQRHLRRSSRNAMTNGSGASVSSARSRRIHRRGRSDNSGGPRSRTNSSSKESDDQSKYD